MTAYDYAAPESVSEAIALLAQTPGARALAGGQRLLLAPHGPQPATLLVDLRKIARLAGISGPTAEAGLWIGAMTTLDSIDTDTQIRAHYHALAEAAHATGDVQLRNRATLGGTLADNDPAADLTAAILALEAHIHLDGPLGQRVLPADILISSPDQTALAPGELITTVTLSTPRGRIGSAYERVKQPASLQALCGVAAAVTLNGAGELLSCRAAITGATAYPQRLPAIEAALEHGRPDSEELAAISRAAVAELTFQTDRYASAAYRRHLAGVLVARSLRQALARAAI